MKAGRGQATEIAVAAVCTMDALVLVRVRVQNALRRGGALLVRVWFCALVLLYGVVIFSANSVV